MFIFDIFDHQSDSDSDDSLHGRGHRRSTPARSYYFGSEADPNRHAILNESSSSLNKKNVYNATYHQQRTTTSKTQLEDVGRRSPSPIRPSSSSDRVMYHHVAYDPLDMGRSSLSKKNAEFRQRPSALSPPPPPSPVPPLIRSTERTTLTRQTRSSRSPSNSRSPSPSSRLKPGNNDTFTKSKGKMIKSSLGGRRSPSPKSKSPSLRDRLANIALLRTKSKSEEADRERPGSRGSRSSSRLVEVRGWENRP